MAMTYGDSEFIAMVEGVKQAHLEALKDIPAYFKAELEVLKRDLRNEIAALAARDDDTSTLRIAANALREYHAAIDQALAHIMQLEPNFYPSRSPYWPAVERGNEARRLVDAALAKRRI